MAWFGPVGDRQCTRAKKVFYAALVAEKTARQAVREARQESRKPLRVRPEAPEEITFRREVLGVMVPSGDVVFHSWSDAESDCTAATSDCTAAPGLG